VGLEKAVELVSLGGFRLDVIGCQPVFIEPYVEKEDAEKAGEVEEVLFDGYGRAEGRGFDSEGGCRVGEDEEISGEEEVQAGANRKEQTDGPSEALLRDIYVLLREEPKRDDENGDDKEEQADGVAIGRGAWRCGGCRVQRREMYGVKRERGGDRDHGQHGNYEQGAKARGSRGVMHAGCFLRHRSDGS